jgi:hypothetical protein
MRTIHHYDLPITDRPVVKMAFDASAFPNCWDWQSDAG